MGKGRLIAVLGPVGVGKSTTIRHLMRIYSARGFRVSMVFMKSYHGPSYLLWTLVAKLLGLPGRYAPWFEISSSGRINTAKALTWLSMYLDLFMLSLKLFKVVLLKRLGFVVFSEEYFQSTIIDYVFARVKLDINYPLTYSILKVFFYLMLRYKPNFVVMLDANDKMLVNRWRTRGYGNPQIIYVRYERNALNKLLRIFNDNNALFIETDQLTVNDVVNIIRSLLH